MDDEEAIKTFYENIVTTTGENANLYQAKLMVAAESIYLSFLNITKFKTKICFKF